MLSPSSLVNKFSKVQMLSAQPLLIRVVLFTYFSDLGVFLFFLDTSVLDQLDVRCVFAKGFDSVGW
jgi:hypothetical protein